MPEPFDFAQAEQDLGELKSLEELFNLLTKWVVEGQITQEHAADYYDFYAPRIDVYGYHGVGEAKDYINAYTSERDLADRINWLGLGQEEARALYTDILGVGTKEGLALRGARGRAEELQFETEEAQREQTLESQRQLAPALSFIYNSPSTTPEDMAVLRTLDFSQPESFEQLNVLLQGIQFREQSAQQRAGIGEQAGRAFIEGLGQPPIQREPRPPLPSAAPQVREFLGETGLARGTRLRGFIESQLGEVVGGVRAERQRWWERMFPTEQPTYEDEVARITAERDKWARIAQTAPTAKYTAGTFWGEGGLAEIARRAAETSQRNLAQLQPFEVEEPEPARPDPLVAALGRRTLEDYLSEFRGLTARQRGFQATRFAPAVRF